MPQGVGVHLHCVGGAVHPLAEMDELAGHLAARRVCRRDRHAVGYRRHAAGLRRTQLDMDCGRLLHRNRRRHPHRVHHADDRRAAADRAVARLRRAGRRAGGNRRVLSAPTPRSHGAARLRDGAADDRDAAGLPHFHRQPHGHGQIAGGPAAAAHHLPQPERGQLHPLRHRVGPGGAAGHGPDRHPAVSRSSRFWRCCSACCSSSRSAAPTCPP